MNSIENYRSCLEAKKVSGYFDLMPINLDGQFCEYFDSEDVIFKDCVIENLFMISSDFLHCTFQNCIFRGGQIAGVVFVNCSIQLLTFEDVDLSVSFDHCITDHLHFVNGWEKHS